MSYDFIFANQQFLTSTDIPFTVPDSDWSCSLFLKNNSNNACDGSIFWFGDDSVNLSRIWLRIVSRKFSLIIDDQPGGGNLIDVEFDNPSDFTDWVGIVITYDSSSKTATLKTLSETKNGSAVGPFTFPLNRISIGSQTDVSPGYSDCSVAHVAIWERVLNESEKLAILNGENPLNFNSKSYTPLIDGLRDWRNIINFTASGTPPAPLQGDNPSVDPPPGYKEITVGSAAAGIGEWGYRDDPLDQYGTIDDDSFDQFGDRISGLYENQEDQPSNTPAFFLEVEPNGIAENQITSIDIGATGQRLQVGIYGNNGGYGEVTRSGKARGK